MVQRHISSEQTGKLRIYDLLTYKITVFGPGLAGCKDRSGRAFLSSQVDDESFELLIVAGADCWDPAISVLRESKVLSIKELLFNTDNVSRADLEETEAPDCEARHCVSMHKDAY
jgi:hypothetical protein